jgi:hypothetical protein
LWSPTCLRQFEEYFVYHPHEDSDATFAAEFPRAVNQVELAVSFLVSIREDALARLDRFKGRIPNLFGNYLRMDRLNREAGHEAIVRPLEEYNDRVAEDERMEIEPRLVEAVLDQVRVGNVELGQTGAGVIDGGSAGEWRIEAPFLQLVLTRLWEEESAAGSRLLRLETLDRLGGAERIVPAHVDAAMAELSPPERDVAARVFHFLVTPSGTKIAHHASDLAEYAGVSADVVGLLLNHLGGQRARILRGTGDGRYEIYHDVLAAAILDWRARRLQATRASRKRQRRWSIFLLCILIVSSILVNIFPQGSTPNTTVSVFIFLSVIGEILIFGRWAWRVLIIGRRAASRLAREARSRRSDSDHHSRAGGIEHTKR